MYGVRGNPVRLDVNTGTMIQTLGSFDELILETLQSTIF
jgi:hypothetical protein